MTVPIALSNAFTKLKSDSSSLVLQALLEIKKYITKYQKDIKLVMSNGVMEDLVKLLSKPNQKCLDVALSILGNCCLEYECRMQVFKCGIVPTLALVLNSALKDSIQGRASRLIGNLALTDSIALQIHKENIVIHLLSVVDGNKDTSSVTRQMAVRALRILWGIEAERVKMLEQNIVHKVSLLLSTSYEKKEDKELLKCVVKALAVFTEHCSEDCAKQIYRDASSIQTLLTHATKEEFKESVILCLYHLCHIGSSRPILGIAGVVEHIIDELNAYDNCNKDTTPSQMALMSTLCLLCRESVNRAKIRQAGGLPIILSILRDSQKNSLQISALFALVQFIYDEVSLQELLKEGMIDVLIIKLKEFIRKNGNEHEICLSNKETKITSVAKENSPAHSENNENKQKNVCNEIRRKRVDSQGTDSNSSSDTGKRRRTNSTNSQAAVEEFDMVQRYKDKGINTSVWSPTHLQELSHKTASPDPSWGNESYQKGDWSPGSSKSKCYSPESSPPYIRAWSMSPASCTNTSLQSYDIWSSSSSPMSSSSVDCEIPEVYSPICCDVLSDESDDENNTTPTDSKSCEASSETINENNLSEDLLEEQSMDSHSPLPNVVAQPDSVAIHCPNSGMEQGVLILLSRVSHMEVLVEDLAVPKTLATLIDYIRLSQNPLPRAGRILGRIVRMHHYFLHLVSHQFVLNVYDSLCEPIHKNCRHCEKLNIIGRHLISEITVVAETGFGEGELSHFLLKADDRTKSILAVTIPFIVKTHRLLKKLLLDCKGLQLLQGMMKSLSVKEDITEYLPICLSLLARSLSIKCPFIDVANKIHSTSCESDTASYPEQKHSDSCNDVKFLLDNGDTILGNRNFLCEQSPVFRAMLQGNFAESEQRSIELPGISSNSFSQLMYIMNLCKVPKYIPNLDLQSAMELLLLMDRFFIDNSEDLLDLIIHQFLKPDMTAAVYTEAYKYKGLLKHIDDIRTKTIKFLLVSDMCTNERRNALLTLCEQTYSQQVQSDIFNILYSELENSYK